MLDSISNFVIPYFPALANIEYTKLLPLLVVLVVGYFLIKGLEEIFKIIFYIFAIAVLIYFFKDIIFVWF